MPVELVTTDGIFELDGGRFDVTNNIWLVGDDRAVVVIDAAHDHRPIVDAINPNPALDVASAVCHALFYFWAAGSLMVYMLSDRTVTTDELFAVGATFTLVAWGFAYVFEIVQTVQPGCFIAAVNPEGQRTWMELLFLSFTNLSSTGLSDVVPITGQARSVVMFVRHSRGRRVARS